MINICLVVYKEHIQTIIAMFANGMKPFLSNLHEMTQSKVAHVYTYHPVSDSISPDSFVLTKRNRGKNFFDIQCEQAYFALIILSKKDKICHKNI